MSTILTGVKPTGMPHVGNFVGAIRPALKLAATEGVDSLLFVADYHALINVQNPDELRQMTYEVAATWLALGLDPEKTVFYRQSDVSEVFELNWILSCFTEKGLMNRAHAYKARSDENQQKGRSPDEGISMGLYGYPVLMAADIVLYDADKVPVGADQLQHLEIARDIVQRINHNYGKEVLKTPEAMIQKETATIPGLDGRKMSKSYQNTIPLFLESKKLRKLIMKIKTDSSPPEAPKNPDESDVFGLYSHFATPEEVDALRVRYQTGIGWGEAKQALYEVIERSVEKPREKYLSLMADTDQIEAVLVEGAERAREIAQGVLRRVREAIGARS